jgi:hypothetical protein
VVVESFGEIYFFVAKHGSGSLTRGEGTRIELFRVFIF